jgi:hypothetical protein
MGLITNDTVVELPFTEADIGGTNSAGSNDALHWFDMRDFAELLCMVELGTWNAADDLDTCKLEQATSSAGAGKKDLTTSSATGDYDTDAPVDADGDRVFLEVRASDLDVDNGYRYVRVYLAETGNTGVDNVSAVYVARRGRYQHKELPVAASAGSKVYVTRSGS